MAIGYTLWLNPDDHDDPANLAELDDDALALIDTILPQAHGARYTDESLPTWT